MGFPQFDFSYLVPYLLERGLYELVDLADIWKMLTEYFGWLVVPNSIEGSKEIMPVTIFLLNLVVAYS